MRFCSLLRTRWSRQVRLSATGDLLTVGHALQPLRSGFSCQRPRAYVFPSDERHSTPKMRPGKRPIPRYVRQLKRYSVVTVGGIRTIRRESVHTFPNMDRLANPHTIEYLSVCLNIHFSLHRALIFVREASYYTIKSPH